jgi:outer membrane protein assembly factor BamB
VAAPRPSRVDATCAGSAPTADCSSASSSDYRIDLPGVSKVDWARLSPDGSLLVASVGVAAPDGKDSWSVVAFDLGSRRELWRVQLSDKGRARPGDSFVLRSGVVLDVPGGDGAKPTVVTLDRATGAVRWERSEANGVDASDDRTWAAARLVAADEDNDFVVTDEYAGASGAHKLRLVGGTLGRVMGTLTIPYRDGLWIAPRVYFTPTDAYVVHSGLARIARKERSIVWQETFPTYGRRPGSGSIGPGVYAASLGIAVATSLILPFGVFVAPRDSPRDYTYGQTSRPIVADGLVCVGSLGLVSCFQEANGALAWSRRFPASQFREFASRSGDLCAATGGVFLLATKKGSAIYRAPSRGVYCVNRSDGERLLDFQTALGASPSATALSWDQLKGYDANAAGTDAARSEAQAVESSTASGQVRAVAAVNAGILVAAGDQVALLDLPRGSALAMNDMSSIGAIHRLVPAGDVVVANGPGGFAAFDAATGALRWTTPCPTSAPPRIVFSSHDPPSLVRSSERFDGTIEASMANVLDAVSYWLLPEAGILVAWRTDGQLVAISLADGAVRWEIEPHGRIAIDGPPTRPSVVVVHDHGIEVFGLGPRGQK